jgi:hypothetical protein
MLYPENLLFNLGRILMQVDFIGPRYLEGSSEPLHFLSVKYVRPFQLHIFIRIASQTSKEVLNCFYVLFFIMNLPVPDVIQMDNDAAFTGFIERKGCTGRVTRWICANGIIPLYNAPSSPWNNGSVEGGNSVFDRKFWNSFRFKNQEELDLKLKEFNQAYETYLIPDYMQYVSKKTLIDPRKIKAKQLNSFSQPNLYLLRIVKEHYGKCQIDALNIYFQLPDKYKGQFVIVKINLVERRIRIFQERETAENVLREGLIYLNL